ncbi:MAG: hypothetical protein ACXW11_06135 [Methylotenera sp.]
MQIPSMISAELGPSKWVRFTPTAILQNHHCDRKTTSYHEAGHFLFYAALGVPIKYADVIETESRLGQVFLDIPECKRIAKKTDTINKNTHSTVAMLLAAAAFAGTQSECIYHGVKVDGLLMINDSDTLEATELLVDSTNLKAALWRAQRLASLILRGHWPAVEMMASIINEKGAVSGEELLNRLDHKLPDMEFLLKSLNATW